MGGFSSEDLAGHASRHTDVTQVLEVLVAAVRRYTALTIVQAAFSSIRFA